MRNIWLIGIAVALLLAGGCQTQTQLPPAAVQRPAANASNPAEKKSPFPEKEAQPSPAKGGAASAPKTSAANRPAQKAVCEDIENTPGNDKGKQVRFFPAPPARVKAAALKALDSLNFTVRANSPNGIEASKKRNLGVLVGAGGEKVFLYFEGVTQAGQNGTRVTAETKRNRFFGPRQKSWTNVVFAQTSCVLSTR